jgi:arabinose-5-phosphate isomerase
MNGSRYLKEAKKVFDLEANAILALKNQLTEDFTLAVDSILSCTGKVIVCGMGKSGIIGQKIAATLASTGTSSFFMHPAEAIHGDLGMISESDIFIAISNSGETEEVIRLIPFLEENGNRVISITGNSKSTLAKNSAYHLNVAVTEEACPLKLAPTTSTTATLVMGDALAVALMVSRDFQPEHFAKYHPGGSLGRKLLTRVKDIMKTKSLPFVSSDAPMNEIIQAMSCGRLGMALVGSSENFLGIITDGDLRRNLEHSSDKFHLMTAAQLMTEKPKTISASEKVQPALELMNKLNISALPVVDNGVVLGVLHLFDCEL